MSETKNSDIEQLFAKFDSIQPEPKATSSAIERVRRALIAVPPTKTRRSRLSAMLNLWDVRFFATAASLAIALVGFFSILPWLNSGATAYAQLRASIEKHRTVTFELSVESDAGTHSSRQMFHIDGYLREENSDGTYSVSRRSDDQVVRLTVNPHDRTADLTYGFREREIPDPISYLLEIAGTEGVRKLANRKIGKNSYPGFVVQQQHPNQDQEVRFWIEPSTQQLVYSEFVATGKTSNLVARCSNFKYGEKVEESLFSVQPPAGFTVSTRGVPANQRTSWPPEKLLVSLGEGIGPITFGMSPAEVAGLLGAPDEDKTVRVGTSWAYDAHGMVLLFDQQEPPRLDAIRCSIANGEKSKTFLGVTKEGVGIGTLESEIRRFYGQPDLDKVRDGLGLLAYKPQGLQMTIAEGKVSRFTIKQIKPTKE